MPAHPADSAITRDLMGDAETAALFADSAVVRAWLLVEGALARVQGDLGLIPPEAAAFIDRASREVQLDPAALAAETLRNGVPIPGFLAAFRRAAGAPGPMAWLHWGATSQDIVDTAQALRLRRVLAIWDGRLDALARALAALAEAQADQVMAARTYGQAATPTTLGAIAAGWGRPILRHRARLAEVRQDVLVVSLAGAAGTLSAMGPQGPDVRAALARALDLGDPGAGWHADRDGIACLSGWMAGLLASLGKLGEDLILLAQTGVGELRIEGAGGSSTMPQKQNPVAPSALVALARTGIALSAALTGAGLHRQQRDGAAWFTEWLTLPQLALATGAALRLAVDLVPRLRPDPAAMARGLAAEGGTIRAEALTFALARTMPRPTAEAAVKRLAAEALAGGGDLLALAARDWPGTDWAAAVALGETGVAAEEARAFARAVQNGRPV